MAMILVFAHRFAPAGGLRERHFGDRRWSGCRAPIPFR
jgi:hypothetical protein